jgi:hypothetical protein
LSRTRSSELQPLAVHCHRIGGIGREHLEDHAADEILAARHGRGEVRIACRHDAEVAIQHQVAIRRPLEQRTKVRLGSSAQMRTPCNCPR